MGKRFHLLRPFPIFTVRPWAGRGLWAKMNYTVAQGDVRLELGIYIRGLRERVEWFHGYMAREPGQVALRPGELGIWTTFDEDVEFLRMGVCETLGRSWAVGQNERRCSAGRCEAV